MTWTPETIWTCTHVGEYGNYFPEAVEAEGEYGGTAVEYTRTDLTILRDDPKLLAMVQALRAWKDAGADGDYYQAVQMRNAALAAWNELQSSKEKSHE